MPGNRDATQANEINKYVEKIPLLYAVTGYVTTQTTNRVYFV